MDVEDTPAGVPESNGSGPAAESPAPPSEPLPEVEAYAYLLVLMYLLDSKLAEQVRSSALCQLIPISHEGFDAPVGCNSL